MVAATETVEIEVCIDCLFVLANGVESDETAKAAEAMAKLWEGWDLAINCPEECDGGFSWSACDGCGSNLGGDRHPVTAFKR